MNKIDNFALKAQDVWVCFLDGSPVEGHKKMACATKGAIKNSFNQKIKYSRTYEHYGFNSSGDMIKYLEKCGRLEFKNLR